MRSAYFSRSHPMRCAFFIATFSLRRSHLMRCAFSAFLLPPPSNETCVFLWRVSLLPQPPNEVCFPFCRRHHIRCDFYEKGKMCVSLLPPNEMCFIFRRHQMRCAFSFSPQLPNEVCFPCCRSHHVRYAFYLPPPSKEVCVVLSPPPPKEVRVPFCRSHHMRHAFS